MKKEVLIAIVSGLILGLIVTLGIYTANKSLEQQRAKKEAATQTSPLPSPPLTAQKTLDITSHENFDLINQSAITLSGIAWPEAVIALMAENDNQLIQADDEGIFSFKFKLVKGFNEITLIATDETNETQTQNLILTYSTSEIELPEETEEAQE
jgi:hypothetical protein